MVSLVLGVLCLVGGFFFLVSVLFLYWVRLFLYMVVVGSVVGVGVFAGFLCLGFVFLLYVWVPRFFVVLGFVFLVRFLGCLGVLVGDFFVFWRLSGVLFCGGGCFWGGFFYLVDVVLLAFVFLGAGFLCGWVLRFLCCVGRAIFASCWLGVSFSVGWFRVFVCRVGRLFLGCVCCVCWFGCVGL